MSRQREYQIRMKAKGCCTQCGKPRGRSKENCDRCLEIKRRYWHTRQRRLAGLIK